VSCFGKLIAYYNYWYFRNMALFKLAKYCYYSMNGIWHLGMYLHLLSTSLFVEWYGAVYWESYTHTLGVVEITAYYGVIQSSDFESYENIVLVPWVPLLMKLDPLLLGVKFFTCGFFLGKSLELRIYESEFECDNRIQE